MYPASITSQWQMSIPAPLRSIFGPRGSRKVVVYKENGVLVVKPVKDLLEFSGAFKTKKKATSRQIREAFGDYLARMAVGK